MHRDVGFPGRGACAAHSQWTRRRGHPPIGKLSTGDGIQWRHFLSRDLRSQQLFGRVTWGRARSPKCMRDIISERDNMWAQTAHPATSSTAPVRQPLGTANAELTPARAPAAAADRKQRPDATCEGKNG